MTPAFALNRQQRPVIATNVMQCEKFCSYLQQECVGKGVGLEEERPQEQI